MKKSKLPIPALVPMTVARMLWKQRGLILVCWVLLSAVSFVVVKRLPNVYSAEAVILVDPQKIPERFVTSTVQVSPQDQMATINQQILSRVRLQRIIDEFHLYSKERKTLSSEEVMAVMRSHLKVTPDKGWTGVRPSSFRISYEGPDPKVVADVVNRIAGLFIQESLKTREERAEGTSEFLDTQLQEARKNLEAQEALLRQFKMKRMGELPQQETALTATLTRLQTQLEGNRDALNRSEQNKLTLEETLRSAESSYAVLLRGRDQYRRSMAASSVVTVSPSGTPVVVPSRKPSEDLRVQLDALRLRYSEDHPDVRRQKAALETQLRREKAEEAQLAATRPAAKPEPRAAAPAPQPVTDSPELLLELTRAQERIAVAKAQLTAVQKEIQNRQNERQQILASMAENESKVGRLPMREEELTSITRDYENSKQNYKALLDKKLSAELATEMERQQQSEHFTLLDPAKVPSKPEKPNRPLFFGGAVLLSLVLAIAIGFGVELPKNQILGEWELPSDLKVLGRISEVRMPASRDGRSAASAALVLLISKVLPSVFGAGSSL